MRKYKKEKSIMIDLNDRKNIKIIESEKITVSDYDVEVFRQLVDNKTKEIEDFNNYVIAKGIESKKSVSSEEFENIMKDLLKQHTILKCILKEQET